MPWMFSTIGASSRLELHELAPSTRAPMSERRITDLEEDISDLREGQAQGDLRKGLRKSSESDPEDRRSEEPYSLVSASHTRISRSSAQAGSGRGTSRATLGISSPR